METRAPLREIDYESFHALAFLWNPDTELGTGFSSCRSFLHIAFAAITDRDFPRKRWLPCDAISSLSLTVTRSHDQIGFVRAVPRFLAVVCGSEIVLPHSCLVWCMIDTANACSVYACSLDAILLEWRSVGNLLKYHRYLPSSTKPPKRETGGRFQRWLGSHCRSNYSYAYCISEIALYTWRCPFNPPRGASPAKVACQSIKHRAEAVLFHRFRFIKVIRRRQSIPCWTRPKLRVILDN